MAGNEFSPEELKILNKNPYTLKATSKRIMFMLWVTREAYRGFDAKLTKRLSGTSKPDQVRALIKATPGRITKTEIMKQCPNIAQVTVQRTLNDLLKSGEIMKISGGRYTSYIWNTEENEP